jgi:hypothetical protein
MASLERLYYIDDVYEDWMLIRAFHEPHVDQPEYRKSVKREIVFLLYHVDPAFLKPTLRYDIP